MFDDVDGSKSSNSYFNSDIYFNRNVDYGLVNKLFVQGYVCACACGDTKLVSPLCSSPYLMRFYLAVESRAPLL